MIFQYIAKVHYMGLSDLRHLLLRINFDNT